MPRTRINCPNCRQPITADIEQLFDVNADPSAKQRLLSGAINIVECPNCGYTGNLATPIVYHDPEKELLLTFVPPEVGLPRPEQERLIGQLINQAINNLPQEKRKGYLFRPQETLTLQGLIERVLEGEGITREMIQAQQQRLNLIQRLMNVTDSDSRAEIAKQEDRLIDAEFFALLRRLVEASLMSGDQQSAQLLANLQEELMPVTTFGRQMQEQSKEVEAAVADLQAAGRSLTREKLLELVEKAPNENRLRALVSLARPAMDYEFFQLVSNKIERAGIEEKGRWINLRQQLLELTGEIDRQLEARAEQSRQLLDSILRAEDVSEAMLQNLPAIDEFFLQELNARMETARKEGDLEKIGKLQKLVEVLQQVSASAAPPEIGLIEDLLEAPDDEARRQILEEHEDEITPEFMSALANIAAQVQNSEEQELAESINNLHRMALRFVMQRNMQQ